MTRAKKQAWRDRQNPPSPVYIYLGDLGQLTCSRCDGRGNLSKAPDGTWLCTCGAKPGNPRGLA